MKPSCLQALSEMQMNNFWHNVHGQQNHSNMTSYSRYKTSVSENVNIFERLLPVFASCSAVLMSSTSSMQIALY